MTTQTSLLPIVSRLALESQKQGGKKQQKKKLEEGEKEMEMEISKGEWWLWIGWPSSGHVRSFPERGGQCVLVQAWDALWGNSSSV